MLMLPDPPILYLYILPSLGDFCKFKLLWIVFMKQMIGRILKSGRKPTHLSASRLGWIR
nr:MAG TPA: hypothetical protein [Caudoviricetes sp.]